MVFLWLYHTCTWNNIFFTFICYLTWHKVFVITLGLSPSVCYLFTFQSLFTEITVDNRTNLCTNVFGCSFVIFWKFKIVQKHFFVIFGNSKLFLNIICDFLEIQSCSSTLFLTFRNSKLLLGQLCFLIGWKFHFSDPTCMTTTRYNNVTLIPLVLQLGLRIGPIQRMGAN
jgi:hypothetical protein